MSKYMGQIMAECDCQHKACEVRGHCLADYIKELEAQLVGMSVSHWQVEPMQQNSPLHDALTRAESAEAKLEQIEEAWSMALYGDLEHGVASLNERAQRTFDKEYPNIAAFGSNLVRILYEGEKE
jgi:hypothetical protein